MCGNQLAHQPGCCAAQYLWNINLHLRQAVHVNAILIVSRIVPEREKEMGSFSHLD